MEQTNIDKILKYIKNKLKKASKEIFQNKKYK